MLGVAALIAVMSVMNGFRAELFDKIIGLNGHAVVQGYGGRLDDWREVRKQALATPGVTEALPLIEQPLMASFGGRVEGVLVRGMEMDDIRSEEHTSELQSLMRISYAVFCLKNKNTPQNTRT